ncbi:nitric oxide reductase transcription regulator [Comamonas serinivorans]|uniref:Nitric oxide reductase transcription regulator n=1 Tax=Comamonas serinivorans TaxID=1082851 RepID=A0A1Y0EJL5_9BURK|nr:nitric oxide reductase transcriptional regulator NorR [Comamonas serinivorans]ARU03833.1 nitric oxide reductase transcription regulator [Comamonas serinivorans]
MEAIAPLVADLAHALPAELRYQRLLQTLRRLVPCDAVALLRLDGEVLQPVAVQGLSPDTLGRRFAVSEHPRLQQLLASPQAWRFPAGCDLPDPYDGLVEGDDVQLAVHDCMGSALRVGDATWGLLTLDALDAGRFTPEHVRRLDLYASLAAATVVAAERMQQLSRSAEAERQRADAYAEAYRQSHAAQRDIVGQSPAMQHMLAEIDLVAPSELTVLVTGETGVGKELTVQRLHARSGRADKPLVIVNCAALPEHLVESELFGHVRGAFSGAVGDRQGKFAMAHGGTLFLDEVGELPLVVQAKLLRALQNGQLQRVGSDREHHVDVRLVAATNRDLAAEVKAGRFRADLYHRLSAYPLHVPPLRERERDVLLLAGRFTEDNRRRMGMRGLRLSPLAHAALLAHRWPGNVRELEFVMARAALKASHRQQRQALAPLGNAPASGIVTLTEADLDLPTPSSHPANPAGHPDEPVPPSVGPSPAPPTDLRRAVDDFQRQLITRALDAQAGNVAATARALGLDRANLVRLANRLDLPLPKRAM